ncbi:hypothetical protein GUJ93_ZPchr0001g31568 [Zizania palustris]|uniref:Secreted protein n=1 Tax=Zizania palustris TaxID=103762 RepID=A0A8J5RRD5_ZIZPA|nr:hypothetical protein GUJ93_ZPchr0001g31568 [Zizania palustris]
MATIFLALLTALCPVLHHPKQKKSSNKWVCVVCNQRQFAAASSGRQPLARPGRACTCARGGLGPCGGGGAAG